MSQQQWVNPQEPARSNSASNAIDGLQDPAMRSVWSEFFGSLPAQLRLLEVVAGTSVLSTLARETAAARGFDWTVHSVDPAQLSNLQPHSFDAACGLYVLERGDSQAALQQLQRVLAPGADAQFVLHHSESVVTHGARWVLQEADLVFKQTKIYRRLHRLVTMDQVSNQTQRATDDLRAAIRALKQALPQAQAVGAGRLLGTALAAVQQLLAARNHLRPQAAGLEVDRAEEALRGVGRRMHELVERACTPAQMAQLQHNAASIGFTQIEALPQLHSGGQLVGWQLLLHRP